AAQAPPAPALGTHRVRACEVDSIGHVNNAVYLEVATQAVLDAIEDAGWSLDRMLAAGSVPLLARADLEYLEGARYGDRLAIATWFAWAPAALDAHQQIARASGERPLVRVSTRWRRGGDRGRRRGGGARRHRPARRDAGRAAHRGRRRPPRAPRRAHQQCGGRAHPPRRRGPQRGVARRPRDQRPRHTGRLPRGA